MVLVPIVVKNQDELEKALKLKRDVIIVKNQELFEVIQKQKKKLSRKKVGNNLGIIGGIIMGVSSFVCPMSIGIYLFAGSIVGVSAGTWGKLTSLMKKGLKNYSLVLDEEKKVLMLLNQKKLSGNKKDILIDGYNNGNENPIEIEPIYVDNMDQFKFYVNQEEKCIASRREFYIQYKTDNKYAPRIMQYKTYESKEDKIFVLVNKAKCDLNICKIKGIDINSIILKTENIL